MRRISRLPNLCLGRSSSRGSFSRGSGRGRLDLWVWPQVQLCHPPAREDSVNSHLHDSIDILCPHVWFFKAARMSTSAAPEALNFSVAVSRTALHSFLLIPARTWDHSYRLGFSPQVKMLNPNLGPLVQGVAPHDEQV